MADHNSHHSKSEHGHSGHHFILPDRLIFTIGGALLFLTVVTVWIAGVDLGKLNFVVAMLVATVKASLVALIFMGLKYDRRENAVIFATSFLFLAIFIFFTSTDLFFRGDVYTKKGEPLGFAVAGKSKFKKAWVVTPELLAHGKQLFSVQCTSCHGVGGAGDGPAAAGLNPKPRNFTAAENWKNGRKLTQIFKTLKNGLGGMPAFASLPQDDRWALAHYVQSLGPKADVDTSADFAEIKIDPTKDAGAEMGEASIPVEFAMKRLSQPDHVAAPARVSHGLGGTDSSLGAQVYRAQCLECHGAQGEGGIRVGNLGVRPQAFITTMPFMAGEESLKTAEGFNRLVSRGLPGSAMPGNASLSGSEMSALYQYVKSMASAR